MEDKMSKRLIDAMQEAVAYAQGDPSKGRKSVHQVTPAIKVPEHINLKQLRQQLGMTQEEFSARYGFNLYTMRNWEHGRRHPDKAVLAYLYAISKNPSLIEETLKM